MNAYVRLKVGSVEVHDTGAVTLRCSPTSVSGGERAVFPDVLCLHVPQLAPEDERNAAAQLVGRYLDVRVSDVGAE